jgi:hypothetical protein
LDELKATGAKSARIGSEEMADRVRWFRTYAIHEPDLRIGTFASMTALIPSRSRACRERSSIVTVVVGTDPIEAKAAE